jgi:cobalamin biosynthesis Mg chelatase CobN
MPRSPLRTVICRSGLVGLFAAVSLALVPAAAHASAAALIRDCLANGKVVGHYSQQDYIQALAHPPTDVDEYSDCMSVIRQAQLNAAAGGKTAAAAAAATPANPRANPLVTAAPAEQTAVTQAEQTGARKVELGGSIVTPGVVAARTSSIFNGMPTPLLIALTILVLIALALAGWRARKFVRARRAL